MEERHASEGDLGDHGRRCRGKQDRHKGSDAHLRQKHLDGEKDTCDGTAEDCGDSRGGPAAHQPYGFVGRDVEHAPDVAADGGARQHAGGRESCGAARSDGQGACEDVRQRFKFDEFRIAFAYGLNQQRHVR